jgi:hypothetical protein
VALDVNLLLVLSKMRAEEGLTGYIQNAEGRYIATVIFISIFVVILHRMDGALIGESSPPSG